MVYLNNKEIIDSKYGIYAGTRTKDQAIRQSSAAEANGMNVTWQVPNEKTLRMADKLLEKLNIKNISTKIRNPD